MPTSRKRASANRPFARPTTIRWWCASARARSARPPNAVGVGQPLSIRVLIRNSGPDAAANASLRLGFDERLDGVTVSAPTGWTCGTFRMVGAGNGSEAECRAESVANGASAAFHVTIPAVSDSIGFWAAAEAASADPAIANSAASVTATVAVTEPADLAVNALSSRKSESCPVASFAVLSANLGPARAPGVRMALTFRGLERLLQHVFAIGRNCARAQLPGGEEGVAIDCRLLYSSHAGLLPPIILQAVARDGFVATPITLDARIHSTAPDTVQDNNADSAQAIVGANRR